MTDGIFTFTLVDLENFELALEHILEDIQAIEEALEADPNTLGFAIPEGHVEQYRLRLEGSLNLVQAALAMSGRVAAGDVLH